MEAIKVRFRPYLSEIIPLTRPPIATPAKNIISPKLFKFSLSQTKSNSEIIVEPAKENYCQLKKTCTFKDLNEILNICSNF